MVTSFCTSPSSIFDTGMPVHLLTILATSSSSTSSLSMRDCLVSICALSCLISASSLGNSPYCSFAARSNSPLRVASWMSSFSFSSCSFLARTLAMISFSCFQRAFRAFDCFLDLRQLLLQGFQSLARVRVVFALQRLALDFELRGASLQLVDLRRHRVNLDAQRGRCFVDQVDGLVGQKAVGDVAVRQCRRCHNGRVLDAHAVVHFVLLAQPAQDRDRVLHVGLAHEDDLEAALQRSIFLDVLAVLIQRGRADGPQLATRQCRLQHVGGVDRTLGRARAHRACAARR